MGKDLRQDLGKRVLVIDGAMGTMLQRAGVVSGCPEELNLTRPELIREIHSAYAAAGADMILTCTFGASRIKLEKYGLGDKVRDINLAAVENARTSAPEAFIVGDVGPLGELLQPLGPLSFDDACAAFKEQIDALNGADAIIIETISDIRELKAALLAAKDAFTGPIISSMTFQDGRSTGGTDVETYAVIAEAMGAEVIGVNCGDGPEGMLDTVKVIAQTTSRPICVQPNAGLPKIVNGKPVWDYPAERFAEYAELYRQLGATLIGGCCGTNPGHIKGIHERLVGKQPVKCNHNAATRLCSSSRTITIAPTQTIGERINPTNRKGFIEELRQGKTTYIRNQAMQQVAEGAQLLDVNVGVPGLDERKLLPLAVEAVQRSADVPLVLDSGDPEALEAALKICAGKPLINSVNGSEKSLAAILPLAKRYGAAVIGLCLDDDGIPATAEARVSIAKRIIAAAEQIGIDRHDVVIDALVMTIAVDPKNEEITLGALTAIKRLGCATILGISNISHGLSDRSGLNARFYTKTSALGLDLALMNPLDTILQEETSLDVKEHAFIRQPTKGKTVNELLVSAIMYGDVDDIVPLIEEALTIMQPLEINDIMIGAMRDVGLKFDRKEYFLPQVLLSAHAMKRGFSRLKRELTKHGEKEKGTVLFATVENDIHDIGKNIVIALLESHNYRVIDLGFNVKREKIIKTVEEQKPDVVALSALMTTTAPEMEKIVSELRRRNMAVPVIVGGAVITDDYASQIKAAYGKDALAAVKKIEELIR